MFVRVRNTITGSMLVLFVLAALFVFQSTFLLKADPATAFRTLAAQIGREAITTKVNFMTRDYRVTETEHFVIKYREKDSLWGEVTALHAEYGYGQLIKTFPYTFQKKILIVIYPDSKEFSDILYFSPENGPMGMYYAGSIGILSPDQWIPSGLSGEDRQSQKIEKFIKEGPVVHEMAHAFVDYLTGGNFPLWFTEGVALYYEHKVTGFEWGRGLEEKAREYSISMLESRFETLNQELAYRRSYDIVRKIADRYGENMLFTIMEQLAGGRKFLDIMGELKISF